jgi:hypothetical protein
MPSYCCAVIASSNSDKAAANSVNTTNFCVRDWILKAGSTVTPPTLGSSVSWLGAHLFKISTGNPSIGGFGTDLIVTGSCAVSAYPDSSSAFYLKATVAAAFALFAAFF